MASANDHLNLPNRNHATLLYLPKDPQAHAEWVATVAFYKAVHIVEACFAVDRTHSNSHQTRNEKLKNGKFAPLWTQYRPLYEKSRLARYLEDSGTSISVFSQHLPAEQVVEELICKRLFRLEQGVKDFLPEPLYQLLNKVDPGVVRRTAHLEQADQN